MGSDCPGGLGIEFIGSGNDNAALILSTIIASNVPSRLILSIFYFTLNATNIFFFFFKV